MSSSRGHYHRDGRGTSGSGGGVGQETTTLTLSRPYVQELPTFATEVVGHYDLVCPVCQSLPVLLLDHEEERPNLNLLDQLVELAEEDELVEEVGEPTEATEVEVTYARRCLSERWVCRTILS